MTVIFSGLIVSGASLLLAASHAAAQGDSGFLRGAGNLDIAVTYGLDTYDEFWLGDTKIDNDDAGFGRIHRHTGNVYAAYGLTDDIDLAASASYVYVTADEIFQDVDALQDGMVQLKWRFWKDRLGDGDLSLLAAPGIKVPLTHYEDNNVNAVGDGNVDLRFRGIAQYRLDNGLFAALETGYDVRFDAPPNEMPIHLTLGGNVGEAVTLSAFYTNIQAFGGHDIGEGPFPGVEEEYDRLGGGVYYRINQEFGVTANLWTTLDGKNTGDVDGFSVGAVFNF